MSDIRPASASSRGSSFMSELVETAIGLLLGVSPRTLSTAVSSTEIADSQPSDAEVLRTAAHRLESLAAAASPGSWASRTDEIGYYIDGARGCVIARTASPADADLIAAMRATVRPLAELMRFGADQLAAGRQPISQMPATAADAARDLLDLEPTDD